MCRLEDDEGSEMRGAVLGAADGMEGRLRQKKAVLVRGRGIDIVVVAQNDELA